MVLDEARSLADGKEVHVPYLIGLSNMHLPPDNSIPILPLGTLRSPRDSDHLLFSQPVGPLPKMGPQVETVLETTYPLKVLHKKEVSEPDEKDIRRWREDLATSDEYRERAELNVTKVRLSLLLASEGDSLIAPAVIARSIFNPMSSMLLPIWQIQYAEPSGTSSPGHATIQRAIKWARSLKKEHIEKLDIGIRRLLSAASTRADPLDGLVDAVICWENMFGATPETVFRVCGAMACLLAADDRKKRKELMKELRDIYGNRNKIVHGARNKGRGGKSKLTTQMAMQYRNDAIRYGLDTMRQLLAHPGLIEIEDSEKRGEEVLLSAGFLPYAASE